MTSGRSPTHISRRSMAIVALSTIVEWYDFTLYLYFATVLARVFFGGGELSLGIALAGFAVSWLLRPLGAFVLGRTGDRYGRRRMMLISIALITAIMLLTALLPTYQQTGATAGAMFLLLRGVMAFSVGGEYTGVVTYLLESAPSHRRGLVTSLASAASEVGALLAAGVSALTTGLLHQEALDSWGWRIPFIVGFILAAGLWVARTGLAESPEFIRHHGKLPSRTLWSMLSRFKFAIGRSFAISALGSVTYYLGITYVPVYLISGGTFSETGALSLSVVAAASVVIITPLAGWVSDHTGRKPVLLFLTMGSLLLPLPVFWLMREGDLLLSMSGAVLLACLAGSISAVGASSTAEMFPVAGRLTGLALGTTVATAIFGGLTPFISHNLMRYSHTPCIPGLIITLVAMGVFPVFLRMPETAPEKTAYVSDPSTVQK